MFKDKNSTNFPISRLSFSWRVATLLWLVPRLGFCLNGNVSLIERTEQYGHFTEKNSKWVSASWDVQGLRVE